MGKHDKGEREKAQRNSLYAHRFEQRTCEDCKHKSGKHQRCALCGGHMERKR